ncbi:UNVERIFIED_ORG: hypothetical protein QFZ59_004657 [Bacillus sp. B2I3]|nr:hypothetical protein [Bacillus sp. B2I3]
MTTVTLAPQIEEEIELQEKLYSMRDNWHLLKPYLNDKDVQAVLNSAMTEYSVQYSYRCEMWTPGNAPWEYTHTDYWDMKIMDAMEDDEGFQKEQKELYQKLYGDEDEDDEDEVDFWYELNGTEEYQLLERKYWDKYAPKEGTMEWYQFIHGCHWINQFTAALISKALNVEVNVWNTDTHTVAVFVKDDIVYHADILQEWDGLQELYDFMGEEVDYYSINTFIDDSNL